MGYSLLGWRWPVLAMLAGVAVASCTSTHSAPRSSNQDTTVVRSSEELGAASASTTASNPAPGASGSGGKRVAAGRVVGPWQATTVGGSLAHAIPLAGTRRSLYLGDDRDLVRVNVATGRIEARKRVGEAPGSLLICGGLVWEIPLSTQSRRPLLVGLDPITLDRVATVTLPGVGSPGQLIGSVSDAPDKRFYIGMGRTIFVIGTRNRDVLGHYPAPGRSISALALSPDRRRLYVTWNIPNGIRSGLAVLEPRTGTPLVGPVFFYGGTTASSASTGGVWLANGQAMTQSLTFHPADNIARQSVTPATYAGGGWVVDSTVNDQVVWISGTTTLACADPRTGTVRVRSKVPTPHRDAANIGSLTFAGGRLYAYYMTAFRVTNLLIQLSPPATCR